MVSVEKKRQQAAERQRRRRARLKAEAVTVTLTLSHEEAAMLEELKSVRRMGRTPYTTEEFFQLLLIRNYQAWQAESAQLGNCQKCGRDKATGGCGGENKHLSGCWLQIDANQLNL